MGFFGDVIGDTISAAGSLIGAKMTNDTNQGIANQQAVDTQQANAITQQNNLAQQNLSQENIDMQEDFAKNGLSMKIADAAKYGISPLAAIGAAGTPYSPVTEVLQSPQVPAARAPVESPTGKALSEFGQNLSRSILATKNADERTASALSLVRQQKENDLIDIQVKQAQVNLAKSASPGLDLGYRFTQNKDGTVTTLPPADVAVGTHGTFLGPFRWSLHNQFIPWVEDSAARGYQGGVEFMSGAH